MNKTHELAWAAGFFDGEGGTYLRSDVSGILFKVSQNNRNILKRFQEAIGDGKISPQSSNTTNKAYVLVISNKERAIEALDKLWPYLSYIKKEQAISVVWKYVYQMQDRLQSCGTGTGPYQRGCRCEKCKRYMKKWREENKVGKQSTRHNY